MGQWESGVTAPPVPICARFFKRNNEGWDNRIACVRVVVQKAIARLPHSKSADPGACEDYVVRINDGGLAWRDGTLRGIESDACARARQGFDCGCCGFMFVADFHCGEDWLRRLGDRNPIYILCFERLGAE